MYMYACIISQMSNVHREYARALVYMFSLTFALILHLCIPGHA